MNPDYRKQQIDPDGERGHNERSRIDKEIQRNNHTHDFEISERILNKQSNYSFKDLEVEIRMNQCAAKDETCFNNQNLNCLTCNKYAIK